VSVEDAPLSLPHLVTGLNSITVSVLCCLLDVPVAELPRRYRVLPCGVTILLLALSFLGTYSMIRRASASLVTRLEGRFKPLRRAVKPLRSARNYC
jgi:hypothetical protein